MGFSNDFSPFNSPQRSFGKELDKLREPLSEKGKRSTSIGGEAAAGSAAAEACRSLVLRLVQFDGQLPGDEEVGLRLFGPSQALDLLLDDVEPLGASLLVFSGASQEGAAVEVVQHVAQLSFLLVGRKRLAPDVPKPQKRFHTRYSDLFEKLAAKEEAAASAEPTPPTASE